MAGFRHNRTAFLGKGTALLALAVTSSARCDEITVTNQLQSDMKMLRVSRVSLKNFSVALIGNQLSSINNHRSRQHAYNRFEDGRYETPLFCIDHNFDHL
jgi:hypothetical protein